jgi:hypothetical protein
MSPTGYSKDKTMTSRTDQEIADRLGRRRARMLPVLAIFFLMQQTAYFSRPDTGRTVDHFRVSAWIVLSVVMLALLISGGAWFRPASVRALLEDEVTRAHRAKAFETGFIATMVAAIALYFFSLFEPLSGRDAVHLLLSVGIACALLRFGMLERRSHRDG